VVKNLPANAGDVRGGRSPAVVPGAFHCGGFSCSGARAPEGVGFSSCGARA